MEFRSESCQAFDVVLGRLRNNGEEVNVCSFPPDAVLLGNNESAEAAQFY